MLIQLFAAFFIVISLAVAFMVAQAPDHNRRPAEVASGPASTAPAPAVNPCRNMHGQNRRWCQRYMKTESDDEPQEEPELD